MKRMTFLLIMACVLGNVNSALAKSKIFLN